MKVFFSVFFAIIAAVVVIVIATRWYVAYQQSVAAEKIWEDTMILCRAYAAVSGGDDSDQRASIEQQLQLYGTLAGGEKKFQLENQVRAAGCYPPDLPEYMQRPAKRPNRKNR